MAKTLALESVDIRKTFGHFTALAGVTLNVERGEFLAFFGRNGAGKTTFLKIAATLVRHTHGRLRVEGVDISESPEQARRSEEHTSELQSQSNLVCRLLLVK